MPVLPTLVALAVGTGLGLAAGGDLDHLRRWRPIGVPLAVVGIVLELLLSILDTGGGWTVPVHLLALLTLIAFGVLNVRVGGMIVVVAGWTLQFLMTLVNGGMPTSMAALESAGLIDDASVPATSVEIAGPRHPATGDDILRPLGEVIPLPTGQVISVGDLLVLIGVALVLASVTRGRTLRRRGGASYVRDISPLGRGPAPRRGPGLHPSRLTGRVRRPTDDVSIRAYRPEDDDD